MDRKGEYSFQSIPFNNLNYAILQCWSIWVFNFLLTLLSTRDEIAEFANSVDLEEVVHNEPPHLDLHCLPSRL